MNKRIKKGNLQISQPIYDLISQSILPEINTIDPRSFWIGFGEMVHKLSPKNKSLLLKREQLQGQINAWHLSQADSTINFKEYKDFLLDIGYLLPEGDDFSVTTENVDDEIATLAGPQLVVPINNARFSLNAANARWGSFFDALYGTDVIPENKGLEKTSTFNDARGCEVINRGFEFLDQAIPLKETSHKEVTQYTLSMIDGKQELKMSLENGSETQLKECSQFIAYQNRDDTQVLLFKNNGLHIELLINPNSPVGKLHHSGIKDIILESAITTIQDCEDSVTAVDAEDKALVYRNWLGLMQGNLEVSIEKQGKSFTRKLQDDRHYVTTKGDSLVLSGRSLMLIRNVGHLMTSNSILTELGEEIPEGIMDAVITSLIALLDIQNKGKYKNSKTNSIYIVKPKMHGPEEVAFAGEIFAHVEALLKLPFNTLKIGIMDEERRTTVNLKECIRAVKERVIFINTGFLDRTGDEIHTSMEAGAFLPKAAIKNEPWIGAYEDWNVDMGLLCGLQGKAQIGKGMWAMPDLMSQMLVEKIAHPKMGANCAWVPSPTASTLHVTHYHQINVNKAQTKINNRQRASLDSILTIPLLNNKKLNNVEIQQELDNNAQGILGYVVRWIDEGIGCSKVPDINNVGLMEDRATLRISSQHLANWLHHGLCTKDQIISTFERMALVVDKQNINTPNYTSMASSYSGIAYKAALDLVLKGYEQPSGYTEPLLHEYRKKKKKETLS